MPCSAVEQLRDVLAVLVHELADPEEQLGALRDSDIARQAGNASFAACTAGSTSSTEAKSTAPVCWPVAGL